MLSGCGTRTLYTLLFVAICAPLKGESHPMVPFFCHACS